MVLEYAKQCADPTKISQILTLSSLVLLPSLNCNFMGVCKFSTLLLPRLPCSFQPQAVTQPCESSNKQCSDPAKHFTILLSSEVSKPSARFTV